MSFSIERYFNKRSHVIEEGGKHSFKKIKRRQSVEVLPPVVPEQPLSQLEDNLWTSKYRPNCLKDMIGSASRFDEIKRYIQNWIAGDENEAILITGPPGIGKTSLVFAIAHELQYKVFEVNCGLSDKIVPTTVKLMETIQTKQVCRTDQPKITTLWASSPVLAVDRDDLPEITLSSNSIILFDDIDVMISDGVNGFWRALKNLMQESKKPIILTATRYPGHLEEYIYPLKIFVMEPPPLEEITKLLRSISEKEQNDNNLVQLSIGQTYEGDVRRTLNEYQYNSDKFRPRNNDSLDDTIEEDTLSFTKRLEYMCLSDLIASKAGIITNSERRSLFIEGKDIPFDQTSHYRGTADEIIESIQYLTDKQSDQDTEPERLRNEPEYKNFRQKLNEAYKKYNHSMNNPEIASEFFPYLSLLHAHSSGRRYNTRGSRTAKVPIGPVDPFLKK